MKRGGLLRDIYVGKPVFAKPVAIDPQRQGYFYQLSKDSAPQGPFSTWAAAAADAAFRAYPIPFERKAA